MNAPASLFIITLAFASAACTADVEDVDSDEAAIVGGSPSSRKSVVVVVDASDRYLCTGVATGTTTVHASRSCGREAAAIYVGFSAAVPVSDPLGPFAGPATKIAVASVQSSLDPSDAVLQLASPTAFVTTVATQAPSAGSTCFVTGYGPTAGTNGMVPSGNSYAIGKQRSGTMLVTSTTQYEVRAKASSASVLYGDLDAFLICGGRLVGPKRWSQGPSSATETVFARLAAGPVPQCTAGDVEFSTAGCATGRRKRTCQSNRLWGPYSATCS